MTRMKKMGLFGVFICLAGIGPLYALNNTQPVDSLFYLSVEHFENGDYQGALDMLQFLDRVYPGHARTTASFMLQAKTLYHLGNQRQAIDLLNQILTDYPKSEYTDDALYGLALSYYTLSQDKMAVRYLMRVVEESEDKRLMRLSAKLSSQIMDTELKDEQLKELLEEVESEKSKAILTIRIAQREMDHERYQSAGHYLQRFMNHYPKSSYVYQMEQLLATSQEMGKDVFKIGAVLPLTGPSAEQGKRILEGMQYAIDHLNKETYPYKVELISKDSQSRVLSAVIAAQELCDEGVNILIGEFSSDASAAVAAVAQSRDVPILCPTAQEHGLTQIGNYVFQMNTDLQKRGEMLAEYAVHGLGLKRFAILAPADMYGKTIRDAFVNKLQSLGGELLTEKWYYEGASDLENYLGTQLAEIRKEGIRKMVADSLIRILPKKMLAELHNRKPGVLYVNKSIQKLADSTDLAVTSIDGLFMPVYTEQLPAIMPQFAFYNIQSEIFGGAYWHNEELLKENKNYIDGVFFLSDFYIEPSDFRYYRLRDVYRQEKGTTPERMEIYGYDAIMMLMDTLKDQFMTRDQVRDALASIHEYKGIGGVIDFNDQRVNPHLHLLQYKTGRVILVQ